MYLDFCLLYFFDTFKLSFWPPFFNFTNFFKIKIKATIHISNCVVCSCCWLFLQCLMFIKLLCTAWFNTFTVYRNWDKAWYMRKYETISINSDYDMHNHNVHKTHSPSADIDSNLWQMEAALLGSSSLPPIHQYNIHDAANKYFIC